MKAPTFRLKSLSCWLLLFFGHSFSAQAAITLDGSLGQGGSLNGPDYAITSDLGRQLGGNLFHSFGVFNLASGESATFSGPDSVANIIGRVTGGSASSIDGLLRSTIPGASLFLINPDGLVFGPNAVLDLGGSFYAGTASYLALTDGGRFDATAPDASVLTAAPPAAFGFLGSAMGSIAVNGSQLEVGTGQQLVLSGGAIDISGQGTGTLVAPGGTIGLYGVAREGEIDLTGSGMPGAGTVHIADGARLMASGDGGTILIRAGRLEVENSMLLAQNTGSEGGIQIAASESVALDAAVLQSAASGFSRGGMIEIETGVLSASGQSEIDTSTFGPGDGGQILLKLADLNLTEGSRISNLVAVGGTGQGGHTAVQASGTVLVTGKSPSGYLSAILNSSFGGGDAGILEIESSRLVLSGGTLQAATTDIGQAGAIRIDSNEILLNSGGLIHVASRGNGDGGSIEIHASRLSLDENARINAEASGGGRAGEIRIQTGTLDLNDGSNISNRTYYYQQGGGDIHVAASESIRIQGRAEALSSSPGSDEVSTGIFSFAGNLFITSPELTLLDSGGISTRTWNDLPSGNLSVETDRLVLLNGGHLSADAIGHSGTYGNAGNVSVIARESILVSGMATSRRSGIMSGTRSSGDAGSIHIATPHLRIENDGMINTSTGVFGEGGAGAIEIQAGTLEVYSRGRILSSSNGYGAEGDITVVADSITLDHGYISAFGSGGGGAAGRIALHAPTILMRGGLINTESDSGIKAGDILIEAETLRLSEESRIKSDSTGSGDAGSILLLADKLLKIENSTVTTAALYASGGNIDMIAGALTLSDGSALTATVGGGFGDGGNIAIRADGVAAVENSDITARADQGHGGRIMVDSQVFLRSADIDLDASSNVSGNEGIVEINAPKLDISGNLVVLPSNYLDVSELWSDPCLGGYARQASSLVVRGRGGIAAGPDDLLPASVESVTLEHGK